ncbi:MAG: isoaspartyl peptidase/L-asparaginase, partial [Pseudomonadota bacterium]
GQMPEAKLVLMRKMLSRARTDLRRGAHGVDVVEDVIMQMEDSGLFNAGRAAITNRDGFVETDASIMDGKDLNAGSVASMRYVKNPIRAARLVMDETRHVMMVGDRGEAAVVSLGAETVPPEYFMRNRPEAEPKENGTVGAAVLDRCGNLAAGTSTGGYDAKIPGRVGDSPNIGAGVYAKNGVMAGSATGHGEYFIRHTALRSVAARMEYGGTSLEAAAQAVITEMDAAGEGRNGRGGIVTVDADGNIAMPFTSDGMVRGVVTNDDRPSVGVFDDMD